MRSSKPQTLPKLMKKIDSSGGPTACWPWLGWAGPAGYGRIMHNGRFTNVTRVMFELTEGVALTGSNYICHHCDNPRCVNPAHLYRGDSRTNARDRDSRGRAFGQRVTHCPYGHEYTEKNTRRTRLVNGYLSRSCIECARRRGYLRYHKIPSTKEYARHEQSAGMTQQEYVMFHALQCEAAIQKIPRRLGAVMPVQQLSETFNRFSTEYLRGSLASAETTAHLLISGSCALAGAGRRREARKLCQDARMLSLRKNSDYSRPQHRAGDPFAVFYNFRECERLGICATEAGLLVRMSDKVARILNLTGSSEAPKVTDERVADTLKDLVNYSCLAIAYRLTKERVQFSFEEAKKIEGAKK